MRKINKETKKYKLKLEKKNNKLLFKEWSLKVKERDNNKCVVCGDNKYINSHHIIPREIIYLRFDINNGVTLCAKHHKFGYELSAHKNSFAFILWLKKNRNKQFNYLIKKIL